MAKNSMYRVPDNVRNALGADTVMGMSPNVNRLALLPRYSAQEGLVAPQWLYDLARAAQAPGNALMGAPTSPEEAFNFAGNVSLGALGASAAMKNPAPGPGKTLPMMTYHSSPHRINNVDDAHPLGRFDLSKVGTGEGAQAYGHGIYLSEDAVMNRNHYYNKFAHDPRASESAWLNGQELAPLSADWRQVDPAAFAARALDNVPAGLSGDGRSRYALQALRKQYPDAPLEFEDAVDEAARQVAANAVERRKGHFYTVDLPDEHIANMLDWDAPLSQQPEAVRKAFAELGFDIETTKFKTPKQWRDAGHKYLSGKDAVRLVNSDMDAAKDIYAARKAWNAGEDEFMKYVGSPQGVWLRGVLTGAKGADMSGGVAYQKIADSLGGFGAHTGQGGGQIAASERLKALGIPGIKYFDGGSRAAGEGTRNFVIFDGDTARILKRE